jgi:hypothetical protein
MFFWPAEFPIYGSAFAAALRSGMRGFLGAPT